MHTTQSDTPLKYLTLTHLPEHPHLCRFTMEYTLPHSSSPIPPLLPDLEVEAGGNLHVVLVKPGTIVLENRPIPEPAANSILVKIMATGMCVPPSLMLTAAAAPISATTLVVALALVAPLVHSF